jgi:DNA-binding GntR family transcriptional regulator
LRKNSLQTSCLGSLAEQAYLAIRERILRGQLTVGVVLSRKVLAHQLGMSMLPICEAVRRLENEGLVESKPRVGTRVRVPTERDIRERFVIREALECQSARLVAAKSSLRQRHELVRMGEQVDAFSRRIADDRDAESLFAVHNLHLQLHMRIAEYSGISALQDLIDKSNLLVFNWMYDLVSGQPPIFHRDLLDFVTGTDVEAAEQAMRKHVQYGLEDTIRAFARFDSTPQGRWRLSGSAASPCKIGEK